MENPTAPTKLCPTCGTRVNEDAPRCLVCGTAFKTASKESGKAKQEPAIQGSRMPEVTLSIPIILLLFIIFLGVGGGLTYLILGATNTLTESTPEPTETLMPTATFTPTQGLPTSTLPPEPTSTPFSYTVKDGDSCGAIAYAFDVSVQSIILLNGLSAECYLTVGTILSIPHPTRTPTPLASNTPSSVQATYDACEKEFYVVQEGETLGIISLIYGVPIEKIMEWSGKTVEIAFYGETLIIPLCEREFVGGATVTPSPAPPYPAPELLLPRNGEAFSLEDETVTLQWSSVGELRENEYYLVTIIDVTAGTKDELIVAVKDTKFIVPSSMRPTDGKPHIFKWSVISVAQIGVDENGEPRYREGGTRSEENYFSWIGAPAESTPSP